ncbi:MAG: biotin transporter BioY [Treponema sp.]|jgi:biotin transport system substrate-specific component|nr:biotin transporter BioY [Treponema sp.]
MENFSAGQVEQKNEALKKPQMVTGLVFTALFAALISAGAFIGIPIGPVPIVLQNMFALLAGLVLGPALGASAVGLFIVAGALGVPVFANNGSPMGIARLVGPSGGYIFGYLLGAVVAGLIVGFPRPGQKTPAWRLVLAVVAGMLVVYVPGLLRLKSYLNIGWAQAFATGFVPFMIGDALKGVAAVLAAPRLRRIASQLIVRQGS